MLYHAIRKAQVNDFRAIMALLIAIAHLSLPTFRPQQESPVEYIHCFSLCYLTLYHFILTINDPMERGF